MATLDPTQGWYHITASVTSSSTGHQLYFSTTIDVHPAIWELREGNQRFTVHRYEKLSPEVAKEVKAVVDNKKRIEDLKRIQEEKEEKAKQKNSWLSLPSFN